MQLSFLLCSLRKYWEKLQNSNTTQLITLSSQLKKEITYPQCLCICNSCQQGNSGHKAYVATTFSDQFMYLCDLN